MIAVAFTLIIMTLIFLPIIYIIHQAQRKELILEDGIQDKIDSPKPPTYEEAVKIESIVRDT